MRSGTVGTVGAVGVGGRASFGLQASSKSPGISFSPEARTGGSASSFSSRNLSLFNREAIFPKSYSIFNINHGKERSPKFATAPSLRLQKDTKGVSVGTVKERSVSGIADAKKNGNHTKPFSFSMNHQNAYESKPKTVNFHLPQKEKPIVKTRKNTFTVFENGYFGVAHRKVELSVGVTNKIDRAKGVRYPGNEVVLWQNSQDKRIVYKSFDMRHIHKVARKPLERNNVKAYENFVKEKQRQNTNTKNMDVARTKNAKVDYDIHTQKQKTLKRRKLSQMIRIHPTVRPDVAALIRRDIKDAKNMVPLITTARKVSYEAAQKEALSLLLKKHEGRLIFHKEKHQIQEKRKEKKDREFSSIPIMKSEDKIYFERDEGANSAREDRVVKAFDQLLKNRGEDMVIPKGSEVADMIGQLDQEVKSEIKMGTSGDGSFKAFVFEIARLGELKDTRALREVTKQIIRKITAVKLASRISYLSASYDDARRVYETALQGVKGFFKEKDFLLGEFRTRADGVILYESREKGMASEVG